MRDLEAPWIDNWEQERENYYGFYYGFEDERDEYSRWDDPDLEYEAARDERNEAWRD